MCLLIYLFHFKEDEDYLVISYHNVNIHGEINVRLFRKESIFWECHV